MVCKLFTLQWKPSYNDSNLNRCTLKVSDMDHMTSVNEERKVNQFAPTYQEIRTSNRIKIPYTKSEDFLWEKTVIR